MDNNLDVRTDFARRAAGAMESCSMSREQFAEKMEVDVSEVDRLLADPSDFTVENILDWATVLRISVTLDLAHWDKQEFNAVGAGLCVRCGSYDYFNKHQMCKRCWDAWPTIDMRPIL